MQDALKPPELHSGPSTTYAGPPRARSGFGTILLKKLGPFNIAFLKKKDFKQ